ncbi:hypothetical protein [Roseofilum casamattae]|uniref:Uncharacterized protein n=1 Tax=Roseofilum casamattae BLCC-M143 TaxID=3022442 RepID=A0ABT7C226_9CYAN|nr:hypothetical protein [Roseofilum casamattae]MDJ1185122.1 hypothetical protein [Roseofilum casamattae BLCC-M143]
MTLQRMTMFERFFGKSKSTKARERNEKKGITGIEADLNVEVARYAPSVRPGMTPGGLMETFFGRKDYQAEAALLLVPQRLLNRIQLKHVMKDPYAWALFKKHLQSEFSLEVGLYLDELTKRGYLVPEDSQKKAQKVNLTLASLGVRTTPSAQPQSNLGSDNTSSNLSPATSQSSQSQPASEGEVTQAKKKVKDLYKIYKRFIEVGSPLEVNIGSFERLSLSTWFESDFCKWLLDQQQETIQGAPSSAEIQNQLGRLDGLLKSTGSTIFSLAGDPFIRFKGNCPEPGTYMRRKAQEAAKKKANKKYKPKRNLLTVEEKRAGRAFSSVLRR